MADKKELVQEVITAKSLASDLKLDAKILRQNLRFLAGEKAIKPKAGTWTFAKGDPDIETITKHIAKLREVSQ